MAFCTRCGRKLEPGEVCHCADGSSASQMNMGDDMQDFQPNSSQTQPNAEDGQPYYQQAGSMDSQSGVSNDQTYQQESSQNQQYYQQGSSQNQQYYQGGPQNQQYYQQGGPQNQQYYQQGDPQNQQYYQQGGSQNQQYYQQGGPQNQQYYQGGSQNQQYYQGGSQNGPRYQQQGPTKEAEWLNQKKEAFVSRASNMFSEILPILKSPAKHVRDLANQNTMAVGLEFMLARMILAVLWVLVLIFSVKSSLGSYSQYVKLPWIQGIVLAIVFTIGADFLWALFLKLFAGAFGGHVTFNGMVTVVGCSGLFDSLTMAIAVIFGLFSPVVSIVIFCCGAFIRLYMEFGSFFTYAQMDDDRKSYAYLVARVLFGLVFSLIGGILAGSMVESFINMIL